MNSTSFVSGWTPSSGRWRRGAAPVDNGDRLDYSIRAMRKRLTYREAGVDIDEGARLVSLIKPHVRKTYRKEVIGDIGGFGALFSGAFKSMKDPVLVSSTDGVGTKLKVAFMAGVHSTIGVDLVAMSVNDILVSGAEPLFFLDYFATGRLDAGVASEVIKGIAKGCSLAGCALIGGETAEMPGIYLDGEYDLAGFAVGVVERKKIIDGSLIRAGDSVIGIASSGLHSNGYSLARKVVFDILGYGVDSRPAALGGVTVGEALLKPTRIYVKPVMKLMKDIEVLGLAHITGGGFTDNIPRVIPKGLKTVIKKGSWKVAPIFSVISRGGGVTEEEMLRTFNCGIGMIAIVRGKDSATAIKRLRSLGERAWEIGEVAKRKAAEREVEFGGGGLF